MKCVSAPAESQSGLPRTGLPLWALVLFTLLSVAAWLGWNAYTDYKSSVEREYTLLEVGARDREARVASVLRSIELMLVNTEEDLVQNPAMSAREMSRMLLERMRPLPETRNLLITNAQGRVTASNNTALIGFDASQREYFSAARDAPPGAPPHVSRPFKTVTGVTVITATRPLHDKAGRFVGVIVATIDPKKFGDLLSFATATPDGAALLIHEQGDIIYAVPNPASFVGKNLVGGTAYTEHLRQGQATTRHLNVTKNTGTKVLAVLHKIPATPLIVVVSRQYEVILTDWRRSLIDQAIGFFLVTAVVLFLSRLAARRQEALRLANAALQDSERFMRSLIDIIPGMVGYWNEDLRCRFANSAYLEWFGKTSEEMRDIRIQDLMGEELFKKNEPFMRAALRGERQHFERTLVKADGSTGYTWAHYIPDRDGEHVRGFFVLVADITELKLAQLQLEALNAALQTRTQEAEAANLAKSQFLANMSHEIRTPMNAVLGLLQLLQHTELSERQLDYTQKAQTAAQSLLSILNDILDFSKVEAGKMELEQTPFRLDQLLRNLAVVLSATVKSKDVEVLFDVGRDIPHALCGDALRLQQVLLNLAGNAVKFTAHGEVVVALRGVDITRDRARIEFSVRDSGIGIAADKLAAIFEGFSQAEASTSRRYGGTGLGLAISQRLVRLMGGELQVDSAIGQGSRFSFTLEFPRDDATREVEAEELRARDPADLPRRTRVLIVDDNAVAREVLAEMSATFGWQVDTAAGGGEAIARMKQEAKAESPYDIVLVDWKMPDMDGLETAQHIRALPHGAHAPLIIMITAHGREMMADRLTAAASRLDGLLTKPLTPSMLFDAVATATAGASVSVDRRSAARPQGRPLAGLRILVVEDNAMNQQVAQELLAHQGAYVEVAGDGRQGVARIASAERPFDLVLMDIQMPDMDGYEATRILRQEMGLTKLPIIAMTANAMAADREACLAAGMNDHIGKPIDVLTLVSTLQRHCTVGATSVFSAPKDSVEAAVLPAGLPALPVEFELEAAIKRLDNNRVLFANLARDFHTHHGNAIEQARLELQQGDRIAAARTLHSLKGVAAMLGALPLSRLAAEAEARIKAGTTPGETEALLGPLTGALAKTIAVLRHVADNFDPPAATEPLTDPARLIAQLQALEPLLAENNMRAADIYASLKHEFGGALQDRLAALDTAMGQLDFATALAKSRNLRETLSP